MDLSDILTFLRENLSLEDILLLILLIVFIIESKCDKLFIVMLALIFIVGLKKDLLSTIFKSEFINLFELFKFFI